MKLAPVWISFSLLACLFACAKVQDSGARKPENGNSVLAAAARSNGERIWKDSPSIR
jgi:hypothetical protein